MNAALPRLNSCLSLSPQHMADNNSSAMTMIVAIVALVIIVGLGLYVFRGGMTDAGNGGGADLNVDVGTGDGQ